MTVSGEIGRSSFLAEELGDADLGDPRRTRRLQQLVQGLADAPDASFPKAAGNDAALEATYRFLSNEGVQPEEILAPHVAATVRRAVDMRRIVVAHDTTEFNFGSFPRQDLGRVGRGASFGFFAHFALAASADGKKLPLGVLGCETLRRDGTKKPHLKHGKNQDNPNNEARRWVRIVQDVHALLDGRVNAIHVMDREADDYALIAEMMATSCQFVIRQYRARSLDTELGRRDVRETLEGEFTAEREVELSARRKQEMPGKRKRFPERNARTATLSIRASSVTIPRPKTASRSPLPELTLNLVHVLERDPPAGQEPVEWWLWTNESVGSEEQVLAVIDAYRTRWVIEEYFKALKTGCAYEKRQLETMHALLNALAVFTPVAWRLLLLRNLARDEPQGDASNALTPAQLICLRGAYLKTQRKALPAALSVREAMFAVAKLGGHITNNGVPGWSVLGRGFDKLLNIEVGYHLAMESVAEDVINR